MAVRNYDFLTVLCDHHKSSFLKAVVVVATYPMKNGRFTEENIGNIPHLNIVIQTTDFFCSGLNRRGFFFLCTPKKKDRQWTCTAEKYKYTHIYLACTPFLSPLHQQTVTSLTYQIVSQSFPKFTNTKF